MSYQILAFLLGIFVFSIILNTILLKLSENVGIRDERELTRWSSTTKPALGGIGFYTIFLLSFVLYLILFEENPIVDNYKLMGLLTAGTLAFLMGLADDAYNTRPYLKLGVQISCGLILVASDNYIQAFQSEFLNYFVTVFWVVGIMNAVNLLDNMDAITTITAAFIILSVLSLMISKNSIDSPQFILLLGVFTSLIGFLFYNWSPSKMYMGDTGSQFLGLFLAAIGIQFLWNLEPYDSTLLNYRPLFLVLVTFALPIIDTTVVFVNRIRRGQSPFIGGKDHTSHNLSYLGFNDRQVAMIYIVISTIGLIFVIFGTSFVDKWSVIHSMIYGFYFFLLLITFFSITAYNKKRPNESS